MLKYLSIAIAIAVTVALGAILFLSGWIGGSKAPRVAAAPPPPEVGVIVTQAAETPLPFEYAGRVVGFRNVEVRPRVGETRPRIIFKVVLLPEPFGPSNP